LAGLITTLLEKKPKGGITVSIYESAIQMERDGEQFYRDLARKAPNKGFEAIFNLLADDEAEHQRVIARLQADSPVGAIAANQAGPNIFTQLKKDRSLNDLDTSQLELYQQALAVEKKSQELYLREAAQTAKPEAKSVFEQLAAQEEQHYFLIHNLVELMLHPQTWVENGEFYHIEEY
jgi:rubrerythrin